MDSYNPQLIIDTVNTAIDDAHLSRLKRVSTTHGGEYAGSCPRCKALGVGGDNVDRLVVWPERPVDGKGSRDEPCFMCRRCMRADADNKVWTGDLVQFVQDVYELSFRAARIFLNLDASTGNETSVLLRPALTMTGAPHEGWQKRGFDLIREAQETLWRPEGKPYLDYLMERRGLKEDIIRSAMLGCVTKEHFVDASEWAMGGGKMVIPRGVVFPEMHRLRLQDVDDLSLWSIAVRLADSDIELEWAKTNQKPPRYRVIRGSIKGLYAYETLKPGLPLCLVEGQIDALTALQEGRGEFAAAAMQSAMGARSLLWMSRINMAELVLIMTDPDAAGKDALTYWKDIIAADRQLEWVPRGGDLNWMLTNGDAVYDFLMRGKEAHKQLADLVSGAIGSRKGATPVVTPLPLIGGLSFVSETPRPTQAQDDVPDLECDSCHIMSYSHLMRAWPLSDDDADFLCSACYAKRERKLRCYRCGAHAVEVLGAGLLFCAADFASEQLLEEGAKLEWNGFALGEYRVHGGYNSYLAFIREQPREVILLAMQHAHALANGHKEEVIKETLPKLHPCARHGCTNDAESYRVKIAYPNKFDEDSKTWSKDRNYSWGGKKHYVGGGWLHWCADCTDGYNALKMVEMMGYPSLHRAGIRVEAGQEAWIEALTHMTNTHLSICFDELRLLAPAIWRQVVEVINL